jgi:hypothetical protein
MDNKFAASIIPKNVPVHIIYTEIIFLKDVPFGICMMTKCVFSVQ